MDLNEDKVVFGIIHTKEIKFSHPYNRTICLHTEYGNLYVQRRVIQDFGDSGQFMCPFCCLEGISCLSGTCIMRFISKYKNTNMKTMKKVIVPIIKYMEEKYPGTDWETYYDAKLKNVITRDEK